MDADSDDEEIKRKKRKKQWDEDEKARNAENEADHLELSRTVWEKVHIY